MAEPQGVPFIKCDEIEGDVFVHHSMLKGRRDLLEGEKVRFEVQETDRGPKAINVEVV
ncbi:MAG: cold-shock protein [Candidatus Bathyarchaeia archaeon]